MEGQIGNIIGIPVFEDKEVREGTYVCLDKHGLPIKLKDLKNAEVIKILVHDFETFKIAIKNNGGRLDL